MSDDHNLAASANWPEAVRKIRARTPARIFVERGAAYSTQMGLDLRGARAAAADAVWAEFDLQRDLPAELVAQFRLFQLSSRAESKSQYLLRPDLGRSLSEAGRDLLARRCAKGTDLQIVIGDGLSVAAVSAQIPSLLPLLQANAGGRGWWVGQCFTVRYCRVGIMNEIGAVLEPRVLVLLIGERPGLATAESLSAYMGYSPRPGHTDADRNLISNIHARGVSVADAVQRIVGLASQMMAAKLSGTSLKEQTGALLQSGR